MLLKKKKNPNMRHSTYMVICPCAICLMFGYLLPDTCKTTRSRNFVSFKGISFFSLFSPHRLLYSGGTSGAVFSACLFFAWKVLYFEWPFHKNYAFRTPSEEFQQGIWISRVRRIGCRKNLLCGGDCQDRKVFTGRGMVMIQKSWTWWVLHEAGTKGGNNLGEQGGVYLAD